MLQSVVDASSLKRDINSLVDWSIENELWLNVEVECVIRFANNDNTIQFDYMINGISLKSIDSVSD